MRLVVKVGTSSLTHGTGKVNIKRVEELCKVLSDIKNAGHELIFVSSGAIAMGVSKLGLPGRPSDDTTKQAAAAVGQVELMYAYDRAFAEYNHTVAQILITAEDIKFEARRAYFTNTISKLIELGVIPVINENDTVSTKELTVGDNDTLAAVVATNIGADLVILLSDIEGMYTGDPHKDPNAKLLTEVTDISEIEHMAGGTVTALGTGGMASKITAAKMCNEAGIDMIIMNGAYPEKLYEAVEGKPVGTRFIAAKK
ncbi:MAG: glutamate 5-kinase [Clostridia bacterium]|nr:glutamate 5-kinase [Clostridia bacterium]